MLLLDHAIHRSTFIQYGRLNHPLSVNKFNPDLMLYSGIVRVTSSLVREHVSISVDLASVGKVLSPFCTGGLLCELPFLSTGYCL